MRFETQVSDPLQPRVPPESPMVRSGPPAPRPGPPPGSLPAISSARFLGRGVWEVEPGSVWAPPVCLSCAAWGHEEEVSLPESEARETDGTSGAAWLGWGRGRRGRAGGAPRLHQGFRPPGAQPGVSGKAATGGGSSCPTGQGCLSSSPPRPSERAEVHSLASHSAASDTFIFFPSI